MDSLLRIVDMEEEFPKLEKENLEMVFKNIPKGAKVAVLGVCGNYRQGKSFLLNVLLEALEDPSKLTEQTVFGGIPFSSGVDSHTKGILFWSKPLRLKLSSGKEVSVILMDTQGTFDVQHDKKVSVRTFAIGNLISSFLIFNKKERLELPDIEGLQLFVQYGKHMHESVGQQLMILLRDYLQCDSGVNLDYINHVISTSSGSQELSTALQDIQQAFEKFTCFTLTEPPRVVKLATGELTAKDCGEEFLEGLRSLLHYIRSNIQEKRLKGESMRAEDLKLFIETIVNTIKRGDAIEISTAYETMERASLLAAEKEHQAIVEGLLDALPKDGVEDSEFENKLGKAETALLEKLKTITCFAKTEKKEKFVEETIQNFKNKCTSLRNTNASIYGKQSIQPLITTIVEEFTFAMEPHLGTSNFETTKYSEKIRAVAKLRTNFNTLPEYPEKDNNLKISVRELETRIDNQIQLLEKQHCSKAQLAVRDLEDSLCREFENAVTLNSRAYNLQDAREYMERKEKETVVKMSSNSVFKTSGCSINSLTQRLRATKERELRHVKDGENMRNREKQHTAELARMKEEEEESRRELRSEMASLRNMMSERGEDRGYGREVDMPQQYLTQNFLMPDMQQQPWSSSMSVCADDSVSQYGGSRSMAGTPSSTTSIASTSAGGRSFGGYSKNRVKLGRPSKGTLSPRAQASMDAASSVGGGSVYMGSSSGYTPSPLSAPRGPATSPGGRSFGGVSANGVRLGRPPKNG